MNSFLIDNTDIDLKDELRKEVYQRALGSSIGHIILIFLFYVSFFLFFLFVEAE